MPLCDEFGERLCSLVKEHLSTTLGNSSRSAMLAPKVTASLLVAHDAGTLLAMSEYPERLEDALADASKQLTVMDSRPIHSPVTITTNDWQ